MPSRWSSNLREETKKDDLAPVWRGVGFIVLVGLTLGGWFGSGLVIDLNRQYHFLPFPVPEGYSVQIVGPLFLRARHFVQFAGMVIVDIVGYALMTIIYGIANPPKRGEHDAAPTGRRPGRSSR